MNISSHNGVFGGQSALRMCIDVSACGIDVFVMYIDIDDIQHSIPIDTETFSNWKFESVKQRAKK